jgi:hypothetical protein
VPGIIDPAAGVVVNLTNVNGWHHIPLGASVSERIGLVTDLENDAKAMAYAEWKHGAGHNLPNVICVTLGTPARPRSPGNAWFQIAPPLNAKAAQENARAGFRLVGDIKAPTPFGHASILCKRNSCAS